MSREVETALRELNGRVLGRPGVSGTAVGERCGKPCLKVYVSSSEAGRMVPKRVGGVPVVVETTGTFRRL